MLDQKTTINELKSKVDAFIKERDWQKHHTAKNSSMAISAEAAELMEFFIWISDEKLEETIEKNRQAIEDEVADIAFGLLDFCTNANIDLAQALEKKLIQNAQKYPIEKSKGKSDKYDKL